MAKARERSTQKLNVALAGIESALSILGSDDLDKQQIAKLVGMAREHAHEAREALTEIKNHLDQL